MEYNATVKEVPEWQLALKSCFSNRDKVTISFDMGKQSRMIISKAAVKEMGNPLYANLLLNPKEQIMLLLGSNYPSPDCFPIRGHIRSPIQKCRQELITRLMKLAGWKTGYRYTIPAKYLDIGGKPALIFHLQDAITYVTPKEKNS